MRHGKALGKTWNLYCIIITLEDKTATIFILIYWKTDYFLCLIKKKHIFEF